jgi:cytochrome c peroxidase
MGAGRSIPSSVQEARAKGYTQAQIDSHVQAGAGARPPPPVLDLDLAEVRKYLAASMRERSHDDGSLGPLMLRYAWHLCGTYSRHDGSGGSNGCTMRFAAEQADPENAGFAPAHAFLARAVERYGRGTALGLSAADLQVLAGTVAIEAMGGPPIRFSRGRRDFTQEEALARFPATGGCPFGDGAHNPNGSRLPAADLGVNPACPHSRDPAVREKPTIDAVRGTFERLGFGDKETVCLIVLGHQFGRCHPEVSGFEHPWYAFDPTHWNVYEHGLGYLTAYFMGRYGEVTSSAGKRQWNMSLGGGEPFMMLTSDMALLYDERFREHLLFYENNRRAFRVDAIRAWTKLTEAGCDGLLTPEQTKGYS